jgi:hypothetical protein
VVHNLYGSMTVYLYWVCNQVISNQCGEYVSHPEYHRKCDCQTERVKETCDKCLFTLLETELLQQREVCIPFIYLTEGHQHTFVLHSSNWERMGNGLRTVSCLRVKQCCCSATFCTKLHLRNYKS